MIQLRTVLLVFSLFLLHDFVAQDVFNAARNGDVKTIKRLLAKDSSLVNAKNEQGFSPLILAAYRNQPKILKVLIERGAQLDYASQEGTALLGACFKGNLEIASLLVNKGASVNISGPSGVSPLIFAVQSNKIELVKFLLTANADKNHKDIKGKSAADYAKEMGNEAILKVMEN